MFSQVVEKSEHAHLWLEPMTISGVGALFGLLNSSPSLQHAALLAIKNLASHPKMAQVFLEYGLDGVAQLTTCKVSICWRGTMFRSGGKRPKKKKTTSDWFASLAYFF